MRSSSICHVWWREGLSLPLGYNLGWEEILFAGQVDAATTFAQNCGGGGSVPDQNWGRDKNEDDILWARRCFRKAREMVTTPVIRWGRRRFFLIPFLWTFSYKSVTLCEQVPMHMIRQLESPFRRILSGYVAICKNGLRKDFMHTRSFNGKFGQLFRWKTKCRKWIAWKMT